jgi:hypothetical protein
MTQLYIVHYTKLYICTLQLLTIVHSLQRQHLYDVAAPATAKKLNLFIKAILVSMRGIALKDFDSHLMDPVPQTLVHLRLACPLVYKTARRPYNTPHCVYLADPYLPAPQSSIVVYDFFLTDVVLILETLICSCHIANISPEQGRV